MEASTFPHMSPLRYTALTAALGTITIVVATAVADAARLAASCPAWATSRPAWWEIAFLVSFGAVIAVLAWNVGARRLGSANTALFIVLVPVVAFGIRMAGGYEPVPAELAGAALVIGALVYANLAGRQPAPSRHAVEHMFDSSR